MTTSSIAFSKSALQIILAACSFRYDKPMCKSDKWASVFARIANRLAMRRNKTGVAPVIEHRQVLGGKKIKPASENTSLAALDRRNWTNCEAAGWVERLSFATG